MENKNPEQEENIAVGEIELKNPLLIDDEEVKKIEYDFLKVKPIQYLNIVKRIKKKKVVSLPEFDEDVQLALLSKASDIPVVDLMRIEDLSDFADCLGRARNFLLGGSETDENEES